MNSLLCFGDMVQILDKNAVLDILQTVQRCTAVDHSAPTLMCTLGVANSILKQVCDFTCLGGSGRHYHIYSSPYLGHLYFFVQYGVEFVAVHVLPLLIPLLITQQLNVQQFAKYMLFVKDVLR